MKIKLELALKGLFKNLQMSLLRLSKNKTIGLTCERNLKALQKTVDDEALNIQT